jgi:hypothetical protein
MTTAVDIPGMGIGGTSGIEKATAALSATSRPDSCGGLTGTATVVGICPLIAAYGICCQAGRDALPRGVC